MLTCSLRRGSPPCLDLLTQPQRDALNEADQDAFTVTAPQAETLLAALTLNHTTQFMQWSATHRRTITDLLDMGILCTTDDPRTVEIHPDIFYSLRLAEHQPQQRESKPAQAHAKYTDPAQQTGARGTAETSGEDSQSRKSPAAGT